MHLRARFFAIRSFKQFIYHAILLYYCVMYICLSHWRQANRNVVLTIVLVSDCIQFGPSSPGLADSGVLCACVRLSLSPIDDDDDDELKMNRSTELRTYAIVFPQQTKHEPTELSPKSNTVHSFNVSAQILYGQKLFLFCNEQVE